MSMSAYSDLITAQGASSWWPMDESSGNITDFSSNGFTGTAAGTLTYGVTGVPGLGTNAIRSNGATPTGFNFGNHYSFSGTTQYTVAGWFNRNSASGTRAILCHYDENLGNGWHFGLDGSNHLYAQRHWGSGGIDATGATALAANTWYHVAMTWTASDGKIRLYVNGVLDATGTAGTNSIASPTTHELTMFRTSIGDTWSGAAWSMQWMAIFSGAVLSAAQLLAQYQLGNATLLTGSDTGSGSDSATQSVSATAVSASDTGSATDTAAPAVLIDAAHGGATLLDSSPFTAADTTELHAYDALWVDHSSSPGWIYGNALAPRPSGGDGSVFYNRNVTLGTNDYAVEIDVKYRARNETTGDGVGFSGGYVMARWATSTPYLGYLAQLGQFRDGSNGFLKLRAYDGAGNVATIGTSYAVTLTEGQTYRVRIEVQGATIRAYLDGVLRITVTDSTASSGQPGIAIPQQFSASANTYGSTVDNFAVYSLAPAGFATDTGTGADTASVNFTPGTVAKTASDTGTGTDTRTGLLAKIDPAASTPGSWLTRAAYGSAVTASVGGDGGNQFPFGAMMPNGDVRVWYQDNANSGTGTSLSTDGGASFGGHSLLSFPGFLTGSQFGGLAMVRRGRSGRYHAVLNRVQWYSDGLYTCSDSVANGAYYGTTPAAGPILPAQVNWPTGVHNLIVYEPFYAYSDDGVTWSTPEAVPYDGFAAVGMSVCELPNGDPLVSSYGHSTTYATKAAAIAATPYSTTGDYPHCKIARKSAGSWATVGTIALKDQFGTGPADESSIDCKHDGSAYGITFAIVTAPDPGGTTNKVLRKSLDGGTTWTTLSSSLHSSRNRDGLCIGPDNDLIIASCSGDGSTASVIVSQDDGATFGSPITLTTGGAEHWVMPFPIAAAGVTPNVGVVWGHGASDAVGSSYFRALTRGATAPTAGQGTETGTGSESASVTVGVGAIAKSASDAGTGTDSRVLAVRVTKTASDIGVGFDSSGSSTVPSVVTYTRPFLAPLDVFNGSAPLDVFNGSAPLDLTYTED